MRPWIVRVLRLRNAHPRVGRQVVRILAVLLVVPAVAVVGASPAAGAELTPGNLVAVRVGTASGALSSAATAVFLDELTPSGVLVRSVALPTASSGSNRRLTMSGSATSEGALALSADGRYLTLAGYDADPGTASIASTTTPATPRVVGRVDSDGTVDTSTAVTDTFSGNNVRGAVTDDGSRFWVVGATGGVRLTGLASGGASTQINTAAPTNLRTVSIAAGQLYVSTGSGTTGVYTVGSGLPTSGGQTPTVVTPAPSPYGFVALDRDPSVSGMDTMYVADDSASPGGGILKYSFDGTTWTARGSVRPGGSGARGLTGAVSGAGVTLFATTSAATAQLVRVDDTAAFDATISASSTVLYTAAANTTLRGVAFAPSGGVVAPSITAQPQDVTIATGGTATLSVTATGTAPLSYQWYTGTAGDTSNPLAGATSPSFTTPGLPSTTTYWVRVSGPGGQVDSRTATVTVSSAPNTPPTIGPVPVEDLALTIGDPDNPPALRTVTIGDAETPPDGLTVSVSTSNPGVATGGTTGTGGIRTLTVNPVGVGRSTLTVSVSDGDLSASTTFPVAVSGALPAGTHNHYGASDASTAVDLGGEAMLVADDETNVLRVYDRGHSRYPAQVFDVRAAGLALRDNDPTREIDIEASARSGDTIYWVGSHGQSSSGSTRLNRQELFTTTVTGTGVGTSIALGGSYQHLRDDLVAWDQANGDALGLAAAANRAPEGTGSGPTGFTLEGAELAPDGTTLLLAFRGPLTADGKAIVVPVTNVAALVTANPTTGVTATFGAPMLWDLGGRGVREIRRNATANTYLIIAGPSDAGTASAGEYRLYSWDGDPTHTPLPRAGSLDAVSTVGKPEALVAVSSPLTSSSTVQVVTDAGDTVLYDDGTIAKDLPLVLRKSTSGTVTVGAPPACTTTVVTIGSVQGTGETSPVAGQTVSVRGTVVGDHEGPSPALRGFSLQDSGDGSPATSDGIFVFDNGANLVSTGDVVQVTGVASEFQGQTQVTPSVDGVEACGHQAVVAPTEVSLPLATADALERYESMLVRVAQTLTVTEHFQLGRFGQVVVSAGGRLRQPTADIRATDAAAVSAAQAANNLNRLIIDDASNGQNPDPIVFGRGGQPLSASNTLRGGDTVTNPVGVLTYTWAGNAASGNAYRLRPVGALGGSAVFDVGNPRPQTLPDTGAGPVRVASANLLNFFNTFTNCRLGTQGAVTDCRGAANATEYQRQLAKEIASLRFLNADVIGFMEMENDGYGPTSAVQALVDALNAADGAGAWAFVDPDTATGTVDVAGTDAIKVGLLYRTATVRPVAGATFVDQNNLFERRPVAQTFQTLAGGTFTVVANHFKSKGSCPAAGPDADQGDGQSCWNPRRTAQAQELARWVRDVVVPAAGDPDVLVVGDLNSYAGEDPIAALEAAGYTNLAKTYQGHDAYSYVFDGQWGYLDYVLASESMVDQVTGAAEAHHNADEPTVLDYNTDFKSPGQVASLYAPDRFRTSDHDPVLAGLDIGVAPTITGTPPAATFGEPYSFGFTVTGSTPVSATVTSGSLPPGVALGAGATLSGTPTGVGDFTFTVGVANDFGSAEVSASIHVAQGASATTLAVSPNPAATLSAVTLTATVTGPGAVTGTVTFSAGTATLGEVAVTEQGTAHGTATLVTTALPAGQHTIAAAYSGSATLLTSASDGVAVAVVDPVTLGSSLPAGTVGTAYSATVPYTGGGPVTFEVSAGALAPGLALSADGQITGTPTTGGTFAVTITARNAVGTATHAYTMTIAKAAAVRSVTTSGSPATLGAPVRFTATVTGPAGITPTGTVQFTVDGQLLGGPVALVNGSATSSPVSTLRTGSHEVTASYSGSGSFLAGEATLTQVIWYAVRVVSPTNGTQVTAGSVVPVVFQLTDANGVPIPSLEAVLVALLRARVSVAGAQTLPPSIAFYDPISRSLVLPWFTARQPTGQASITIEVTYPGAPTQRVTTTVTLT